MAEEPEITLPTSAGSLKKQGSSRKTSVSALLTMPKPMWKIMKDKRIPDHLTCHLKKLDAGQEATVRTGHRKTDWFQIWKGVRQGCRLSPCLTYMQSPSRERLVWKKHKLKSRLPGGISITSDMQMTPPLWQKVKRS